MKLMTSLLERQVYAGAAVALLVGIGVLSAFAVKSVPAAVAAWRAHATAGAPVAASVAKASVPLTKAEYQALADSLFGFPDVRLETTNQGIKASISSIQAYPQWRGALNQLLLNADRRVDWNVTACLAAAGRCESAAGVAHLKGTRGDFAVSSIEKDPS